MAGSSARITAWGVLGVLAIGLSGCLSSKMTYGTGVAPGKQTVSDLVSIVPMLGPKKPNIDYTPRAGVVEPPKNTTLPAPGDTNSVASADWPISPDAKDKKNKKFTWVAKGTKDNPAGTAKNPASFVITFRPPPPEEGVRAALTDPPIELREPDPSAPINPATTKKKKKFRWPWQSASN